MHPYWWVLTARTPTHAKHNQRLALHLPTCKQLKVAATRCLRCCRCHLLKCSQALAGSWAVQHELIRLHRFPTISPELWCEANDMLQVELCTQIIRYLYLKPANAQRNGSSFVASAHLPVVGSSCHTLLALLQVPPPQVQPGPGRLLGCAACAPWRWVRCCCGCTCRCQAL
jgi:hypothetical protein